MATTLVGGAQSQRRPSPSRGRKLGPRLPGRGRNRPALVLGLVLIVGCGAASAAIYSNATRRDAVLAVARDVPPGARVTAADLRVVRVAAASSVRTVPASARSRAVGRVARVGLVQGSLLTPAQLAAGEAVPAGQSVVALLLRFGQAPTLSPGDDVLVIAPSQNLTAPARVFAVERQRKESDDVRVSVVTDEATAARIATVVAARGEITVVLRSSP